MERNEIMKKRVIIAVGCVILMFAFSGCSTTIDNIKSDLDDAKYENLVQDYSNIDEADKEAASEQIVKAVQSTIDAYETKEMDYEDVKALLDSADKLGIMDDSIDDLKQTAKDIKNSRNYFSKAEASKDDDVVKAFEYYGKVAENDKLNYDKAQTQLKSLEKKIKDLEILKVVKTGIIVQSTDYKILYPDMIQVIVKNTSKTKTVKEFVVGVVGYDNNGFPIKIKLQYDFDEGEYLQELTFTDANMMPGEKSNSNYGWNLSDDTEISEVRACVKSAVFYGGETWDNPLYENWENKYKDVPLSDAE